RRRVLRKKDGSGPDHQDRCGQVSAESHARDSIAVTRCVSAFRVIRGSARSEPFPVAAAEAGTIPRLVFGPVSHVGLVAGVGGFELALAFEIPAARLVFAARLDAVQPA